MDRSQQCAQLPEAPGSPEPSREYEAPAILWEQEFVALALISAPPCDPATDPSCTP